MRFSNVTTVYYYIILPSFSKRICLFISCWIYLLL